MEKVIQRVRESYLGKFLLNMSLICMLLGVLTYIELEVYKDFKEKNNILVEEKNILTDENNELYDSVEKMQNKINKYEESVERLDQSITKQADKNSELQDLLHEKQIQLSKEKSSVWKSFRMTHYTADCRGCSGTTFSGYDVRNTIYYKNRRVIAVDKNLIPIGSIVEISDGENTFKAQALDIGGAIKGNKIDLLVKTKSEAYKLGNKSIKVKIIRKGW